MHTDVLAVAKIQQLPSTLLGMKKFTSQFLTMSSPVQAAGVPAMPWGQLLSLVAHPQQALGATESWDPSALKLPTKKKDERLGAALNGNWVQRISLDCQVILITSMVVLLIPKLQQISWLVVTTEALFYILMHLMPAGDKADNSNIFQQWVACSYGSLTGH